VIFLNSNELHATLKDHSWSDVLALAEEDTSGSVRDHITTCPECIERGSTVTAGELAALPEDRRATLLRVAAQIASLYQKEKPAC
jgi:hypothetical protein